MKIKISLKAHFLKELYCLKFLKAALLSDCIMLHCMDIQRFFFKPFPYC